MTFISTSDERLKISTDAAKHLSVDVLALAKWEHLRLLQSRICGIDEKLSKLGFFSWGKKKKKGLVGATLHRPECQVILMASLWGYITE